MRRSMIVFALAVLAFISALIWFAVAAPERVPGHFNASGEVDRWDSKGVFLASVGGGGFALIAIFLGLTALLPKLPARWINLPSQKAHEYWTSLEHRGELNRVMAGSMEVIGAAVAALFTAIVVTSGLEARDASVPGWAFGVPLAIMLGTVVLTLVYIFRRTRVPRGLRTEKTRARGGRRGASRGRDA